MSYLDKLLQGVEVEWKLLGEMANVGTGNSNRQDEVKNGTYPFYVRSKNILRSSTFQFDETAIVIPGEGGIGEIFHFVEGKYALHQRAYRISVQANYLNTKYLYYIMYNSFKQYIISKSVGATATSIRKPMLENYPIPIPYPHNPKKSLKIQQEIVHVLDRFTELTDILTDELSAELIARKTQYECYREELFTFNEKEVKYSTLGELGEFQRGKRFVKTDMISEGIPCIHYGEMYTYYNVWADESKSFLSKELVESKKLRVAEKNDIIIVAAGETIEDIGKGTAWLGNKEVVIHDACFSYRSNLNPKYLAYFTRTKQFHDQIKKHISSGKISAINEKGLAKVLIPIPSSEKQERIVTILDKFDTLITSIIEELPKEVDLRNKKYEYYRNLLLTFPEIK